MSCSISLWNYWLFISSQLKVGWIESFLWKSLLVFYLIKIKERDSARDPNPLYMYGFEIPVIWLDFKLCFMNLDPVNFFIVWIFFIFLKTNDLNMVFHYYRFSFFLIICNSESLSWKSWLLKSSNKCGAQKKTQQIM